jgi:hypothetical protein
MEWLDGSGGLAWDGLDGGGHGEALWSDGLAWDGLAEGGHGDHRTWRRPWKDGYRASRGFDGGPGSAMDCSRGRRRGGSSGKWPGSGYGGLGERAVGCSTGAQAAAMEGSRGKGLAVEQLGSAGSDRRRQPQSAGGGGDGENGGRAVERA